MRKRIRAKNKKKAAGGGVGGSIHYHCYYTVKEQFLKNYRRASQQWNCCLTFYVLFEDFDTATKRSLAIDVCICLNHQECQSLASLSAGSRR